MSLFPSSMLEIHFLGSATEILAHSVVTTCSLGFKDVVWWLPELRAAIEAVCRVPEAPQAFWVPRTTLRLPSLAASGFERPSVASAQALSLSHLKAQAPSLGAQGSEPLVL